MHRFIILTLTLLLAHEASAFRFKVVSKKVGTFEIPFVLNADVPENTYSQKASFAEIERLAPLNRGAYALIEPKDLRSLSMEEFNQIYARLSSGPMPLGDYAAYVMQKPPLYQVIKKRLLKQAMGFGQFASLGRQVCGQEVDDCLFEFIWKGKRFSAKDDMDQIKSQSLFNLVSSGFKISLIPDFLKSKKVDEAIDFTEGLIDKASLTFFPMHTYCGVSQVDTRRESIIVDGAFGDDFGLPSYIAARDEIVTRKRLNISEEYRMLRPGLYIGKVYANKIFLFNVVLEKTGVLKQNETKDACLDTIKDL